MDDDWLADEDGHGPALNEAETARRRMETLGFRDGLAAGAEKGEVAGFREGFARAREREERLGRALGAALVVRKLGGGGAAAARVEEAEARVRRVAAVAPLNEKELGEEVENLEQALRRAGVDLSPASQ